MKKPIASLLAMNLSLEGRTLHLIMHVMRSVLIISAASLLLSCGMLPPKGKPPVKAASCSNIAPIAGGLYHTVGLKEDGTVVAVGKDLYGQMNVSSWTNIKAIAAGEYYTVGLKEDGTVVAV